eukprot:GILK01008742.1.p1 GENE.GILK01008742.1~~GILK01008742.1.p1  ORF type:complete len:411 (+),score=25.25 GILK01008742.1:43-1275(+)
MDVRRSKLHDGDVVRLSPFFISEGDGKYMRSTKTRYWVVLDVGGAFLALPISTQNVHAKFDVPIGKRLIDANCGRADRFIETKEKLPSDSFWKQSFVKMNRVYTFANWEDCELSYLTATTFKGTDRLRDAFYSLLFAQATLQNMASQRALRFQPGNLVRCSQIPNLISPSFALLPEEVPCVVVASLGVDVIIAPIIAEKDSRTSGVVLRGVGSERECNYDPRYLFSFQYNSYVVDARGYKRYILTNTWKRIHAPGMAEFFRFLNREVLAPKYVIEPDFDMRRFEFQSATFFLSSLESVLNDFIDILRRQRSDDHLPTDFVIRERTGKRRFRESLSAGMIQHHDDEGWIEFVETDILPGSWWTRTDPMSLSSSVTSLGLAASLRGSHALIYFSVGILLLCLFVMVVSWFRS